MAYPLIILGAGASYDYSPIKGAKAIAPLTKELVDPDYLLPDLLERYTGAGVLMGEIMAQVRGGKSFEQALTDIKENTAHSAPMREHFVDMEFFLRDLFRLISDHTRSIGRVSAAERRLMHSINNYGNLISRLDTYTEGKACVVTFNYDSLFESALGEKQPERIADYVRGDIKLFKLHGSHDWIYVHRKNESDIRFGGTDSLKACRKGELLSKIQKPGSGYEVYHVKEIEGIPEANDFFHIPALAVPLVGKDRFVSPDSHAVVLSDILPSVDRILVVGWRAEDPLLLETLKQKTSQRGVKRVVVVSESQEGAEKIVRRIHRGLNLIVDAEAVPGGFTNFMATPLSHEFFSERYAE